jgi:pyoverdine/dityrosine biosynthesis protein Dit1
MLQTTANILDVFELFRMQTHADDQFDTVGRDVLADKVQKFVINREPIKFSMLGYPYKSPNIKDKVIGVLPDLAEKVSLDNFNTFDRKIKEVYSPGVNISLIQDGYAFNKVWGDVTDNTVKEYEEMVRDWSKDYSISWYGMHDFWPKWMSLDDMRNKTVEQFGVTPEELTRRILVDPDVNYLYTGMVKFLELDLAIYNYPTRNQLHVAAKKTARDMMIMNEAYSALIKANFGDHIRLSMHKSVNNGNKYSFQLIPSPKAWTSPWHCALLINKDGMLETVHRKDAEAAGHELVYQDGRPYYFTEH